MTSILRRVVPAVAMLSFACALGPGEPFAVVSPTLDARYLVPEDRVREDGFARLASDYEVRVDNASITLGHFEVTRRSEGRASAGGSGGGGTFDPANPPPGYSLCHGGHCHRDDGALIPYDEIEAELQGGGGTAEVQVAMTLETERTIDLIAGFEETVACAPDCDLDQGELTGVRGEVRHLRIEGRVRDTRPSPRIPEQGFVLEATFEEGSEGPGALLSAPLSLVVDRRQFPNLALELELHPGPQMFDGVDWAALAGGSVIRFEPTARDAVLDAFAATSFEVQVTRSP